MELLIVVLVIVLIAAPILGIAAYVRVRVLMGRVRSLEAEMSDLRRAMNRMTAQAGQAKTATFPAVQKLAVQETAKAPAERLQEATALAPEDATPAIAESAATEKTEEQIPESISEALPAAAGIEASPIAETTGVGTTPIGAASGVEAPVVLTDLIRAKVARYTSTSASSSNENADAPSRDTVSRRDNRFELQLGTRWLNWAGAVLLLFGVAYFLKYAYDNGWIGPQGRLAIGTFAGVVALALGERFRRKKWDVLFQSLSGIGIGIFYICVYFSFQIYHLAGQQMAFGLASCVTLLAIALAVVHDARYIAVFGLVGGFLSPILLSTGENHPYGLFSYIILLDLVALGAAYFRKWRIVDILSFAGTALIYAGWADKFYFADRSGQLTPALIFISIFFVMFLVIPTLNSLVRRTDLFPDGPIMVLLNSVFALACYYVMLYTDHRWALGFVVLGQALIVFMLFQAWIRRLGPSNPTSESLLIIALAQVILAVPLHLRMYGIAITWGAESAVLAWLGVKYRKELVRLGAIVALMAGVGNLLSHLPIHTLLFVPVFNLPFGAWMFVAASGFAAAKILSRPGEATHQFAKKIALAAFLIGFATLCYGLTLEVAAFWSVRIERPGSMAYQGVSLSVLWSVIAATTAVVLYKSGMLARPWRALAAACYIAAAWLFLLMLVEHPVQSRMLFLNPALLSYLAFPAALWIAASLFWNRGARTWWTVFESAGHVALALVLAAEFTRWGGYHGNGASQRIASSFLSASWALLAFALIWFGLYRRVRLRRILGFGLFATTVAKVLLIDMSELEKVYRILSFIASGLLLVTASYFYQRYVPVLLSEQDRSESLREG